MAITPNSSRSWRGTRRVRRHSRMKPEPQLVGSALLGAEVTERRTAIDYAKILRDLSDIHFPKAEKIVLVQHNLNTHTPASLYEAFEPAEARRIALRFEWHYTHKHGSWLNLAESELPFLPSQCLDRRIPDAAILATEADAWRMRRNTRNAKANWHFTTADA